MKETIYKIQQHLIGSIPKNSGSFLILYILIVIWNMIMFIILKRWKIKLKQFTTVIAENKQDDEVLYLKIDYDAP